MFTSHARVMPEWLNLETLSLPGRQARFREPLRTNLDTLTEELVESCAKRDVPYVFFGYCTGALLAYCVARGLHAQGAILPRRIIIGSFKAPHLATQQPLSQLDSEELWKFMIDHEAIPPQLADRLEFRVIAEPVLRADMALINGYRHSPAPSLPVPISVIIGERDPWITHEDASSWSSYTIQGLNISHLPTGHWFMEEQPMIAAETLAAEASIAVT